MVNGDRFGSGISLLGVVILFVYSGIIAAGCASTPSSDDHDDVDISDRIAELTIKLDSTDGDDVQSPALMHQLGDLHRERAEELSDRDLIIDRSDERCFIPLEMQWDESVFGSTKGKKRISTANHLPDNNGEKGSLQSVVWRSSGLFPLSFDDPKTIHIYSGHCAVKPIRIADHLSADALEHLEKSRAFYDTVAERYPDYDRGAEILFGLGRVEMLVGNAVYAIQSLNSLIETFPKSEFVLDAKLAIADYFFAQRQLMAAEKLYVSVLESQDSVLATYAQFMLGWSELIGGPSSHHDEEHLFAELLQRELPPELDEAAVHRGAVTGLAYVFVMTYRRDEDKSPEEAVRYIESVTERRSRVYEFFRILSIFCQTSTTKLFNCPEGAVSITHQLAILMADDGEMDMARQLAKELCDDGHSPSCELLSSME